MLNCSQAVNCEYIIVSKFDIVKNEIPFFDTFVYVHKKVVSNLYTFDVSELLEKISLLLKEKKKTQKDLCEFLGVGKQAFTNWKSGFSKSYTKYLPQIASYFGVSVDYLIGKTEQKEKSSTENSPNLSLKTPTLSTDESRILLTYRILTDEGKKKAAEYIGDLAGNPNYVADDKIYYLPSAAFDGKYPAEKIPYTAEEVRILLNSKKIDGEDF